MNNSSNGYYTKATMDSTQLYNYLKRVARKTANEHLDCTAEALIQAYGDDREVDKRDAERICTEVGHMTPLQFRELECHVTTSLSTIPFSVAHVD
jgi:hypothetical protein